MRCADQEPITVGDAVRVRIRPARPGTPPSRSWWGNAQNGLIAADRTSSRLGGRPSRGLIGPAVSLARPIASSGAMLNTRIAPLERSSGAIRVFSGQDSTGRVPVAVITAVDGRDAGVWGWVECLCCDVVVAGR